MTFPGQKPDNNNNKGGRKRKRPLAVILPLARPRPAPSGSSAPPTAEPSPIRVRFCFCFRVALLPAAMPPLHRVPPRLWEAARRLRGGLLARLPGHYLRALEAEEAEEAVHWRPLPREAQFARNPASGRRERRQQDVPVPVFRPPESQEGLWGGEGWVSGFRYANGDKVGRGGRRRRRRRRRTGRRGPRAAGSPRGADSALAPALLQLSARVRKTWKPQLFYRQLYSEILDRRLTVTVTARTLDQIDAAFGFDAYILKEFVIPEEEAEWVGLSLEEAVEKQRLLEKKDPIPLFKLYAEELVQQFQEQRLLESAEGRKP
ncbi:hypothetical protein JD844_020152 [Phrynosoma platyrhinos]|uniref:Large ribosomal subunit protein bL28m n=1 Tax=Phrynosoma platyrhinos TaxID=52577 RepID=A0ABQ7TRT9_PHRPL|nr:hypothetical protein JD844_020152 [Phrynosoma platyrhinos]